MVLVQQDVSESACAVQPVCVVVIVEEGGGRGKAGNGRFPCMSGMRRRSRHGWLLVVACCRCCGFELDAVEGGEQNPATTKEHQAVCV